MSKTKEKDLSVKSGIQVSHWPKLSNKSHFISYSNNSRKKFGSKRHLNFVLFVFAMVWIIAVTYFFRDGNKDMFKITSKNKGNILSLEKQSQKFSKSGFEYFSSNPLFRRPKLTSSKIWLLRPHKSGMISLKNFFKHSKQTHVSVLIKYFIAFPSFSKLSVTGKNYNSLEEVTVDLSQYGDGYCTRVLYFGIIHEVF